MDRPTASYFSALGKAYRRKEPAGKRLKKLAEQGLSNPFPSPGQAGLCYAAVWRAKILKNQPGLIAAFRFVIFFGVIELNGMDLRPKKPACQIGVEFIA
ncbi:hypothetical protein [Caldibacillus debilis]|uniref:Uncharacterized protein n=1 Tax=Caldibacillus debilis GB1 TaxID=1339248 RepID=A0A420VBQ1_9BACI|nr:hypothetical protein [Caldibacillus debilis]RKO61044.1 hypothetical protein Cdeb_01949 [Caldibacillus debilis GB1]